MSTTETLDLPKHLICWLCSDWIKSAVTLAPGFKHNHNHVDLPTLHSVARTPWDLDRLSPLPTSSVAVLSSGGSPPYHDQSSCRHPKLPCSWWLSSSAPEHAKLGVHTTGKVLKRSTFPLWSRIYWTARSRWFPSTTTYLVPSSPCCSNTVKYDVRDVCFFSMNNLVIFTRSSLIGLTRYISDGSTNRSISICCSPRKHLSIFLLSFSSSLPLSSSTADFSVSPPVVWCWRWCRRQCVGCLSSQRCLPLMCPLLWSWSSMLSQIEHRPHCPTCHLAMVSSLPSTSSSFAPMRNILRTCLMAQLNASGFRLLEQVRREGTVGFEVSQSLPSSVPLSSTSCRKEQTIW